ncbi:SWIM zinc finger family protein [Anaerotruncus colihominis]|uniref:SWIM zinc finger domain protein n=2 Tax=Anaerotruncus colihominis TaxID=169435 RepID=B0PEU3_9FIRM|nr:SWIM zinc finger family protein [Anaerotruncus colihominis]EDS09876.1 SWIM zinc finger domain protein [Anaerotruncus colihominis DSM 17241]OUP65596.1 hypothetical protein B5F11_19745 [Anaerotruncus colihominis]OUP69715.1 hypothetical protein B5F10_19700 [Anaerotruncus colihominis]UWN73930.1 SWIM zinc finger domain-containing protein [Anaerotruncus colihominis]CUQ03091.1 SWIM zinc finger [Anaerotruncus colihominis]
MKFLLSSSKGKGALALCILAILGCFSAPKDLSVIPGVIVMLIMAFVIILPEIKYLRSSSEKLWKKWELAHDSKTQFKRMERAAQNDCTIKQLDKLNRYALFSGKQGKPYRTTLISCTCPDFKERKLPCKHMYKLAQSLELIDLAELEEKSEDLLI